MDYWKFPKLYHSFYGIVPKLYDSLDEKGKKVLRMNENFN